jgi:hypothetical protein
MTTRFGVFGETQALGIGARRALIHAPGAGPTRCAAALHPRSRAPHHGLAASRPGPQGDPFVDTAKPDPRDKGVNFKVAACKRGKARGGGAGGAGHRRASRRGRGSRLPAPRAAACAASGCGRPPPWPRAPWADPLPSCRPQNNDACFDKLRPLFEGEPHVDPLRRRLQAAKGGGCGGAAEGGGAATRGGAAPAPERPFKVASPMKASACPGDFIGTLGGKIEYLAVRGWGRPAGVAPWGGWQEEVAGARAAAGASAAVKSGEPGSRPPPRGGLPGLEAFWSLLLHCPGHGRCQEEEGRGAAAAEEHRHRQPQEGPLRDARHNAQARGARPGRELAGSLDARGRGRRRARNNGAGAGSGEAACWRVDAMPHEPCPARR